ncbi:MAG TPA: hypothetical protein VLL27_08430 [Solirubrobacterales bacterium]|nr:hypothetical protein [Solirubrobacterales bacterium]
MRSGVATRFLQVGACPVLVRAWQPARDRVILRAEAVEPRLVSLPGAAEVTPEPARREQLELGVERMRFALGVDLDLGAFQRRFRRDGLLGPLIRRMPDYRPGRTLWPWEALVSAIVGQLIEADRAARIERRIVGRWGARIGVGRAALRDVPAAAMIAGRAPAELQSMDLSAARAVALCRLARHVAAGRCALESEGADQRLLATPEIGPWTVQRLALYGRGDLDSLPAGDLAYIKLVGRLASLGRRATISEVEEFYAPYEPYRGLAGCLTLVGLHHRIAQGPPLRYAA